MASKARPLAKLGLGQPARWSEHGGSDPALCWFVCTFGTRGRFGGAFWASRMFRTCSRACHTVRPRRLFRAGLLAFPVLAGACFGLLAFPVLAGACFGLLAFPVLAGACFGLLAFPVLAGAFLGLLALLLEAGAGFRLPALLLKTSTSPLRPLPVLELLL